jgi:hypothetical protein
MRPRLALFALLLMCGAARAEFHDMTCQSGKEAYQVTYDTQSRAFTHISEAGKSNYLVSRVQIDGNGVLVAGRVGQYGHDFVALFAPNGFLHNLYANGSKIEHRCRER